MKDCADDEDCEGDGEEEEQDRGDHLGQGAHLLHRESFWRFRNLTKKLLHSPRAVDPLLQRLALLTTTYWFLSPKRLENLLVVVKLNNLKTLKKAWFNMNSAFSNST